MSPIQGSLLALTPGAIFSIHDETHHHHPHHAHPEPVGKIGVRTVTQWSFGLGLEFDCSTQCTEHTVHTGQTAHRVQRGRWDQRGRQKL